MFLVMKINDNSVTLHKVYTMWLADKGQYGNVTLLKEKGCASLAYKVQLQPTTATWQLKL
jgi:hypothetical protein